MSVADRTIPKLSGTRTRAAAIAEALSEDIETGAISPGTKLTEESLAERFGVSRGPVREALGLLARDGLVRIRPHIGAFVPRLTLEEVLDLHEVRNALFSAAARRFTRRMREGALPADVIAAYDAASDALLAAQDTTAERFSQLSAVAAGIVFEGCGNELLHQHAMRISRLSFRFYLSVGKQNPARRRAFLRLVGMLREAARMGDDELAFTIAQRLGDENRRATLEQYRPGEDLPAQAPGAAGG